jgi:hypothetical protein
MNRGCCPNGNPFEQSLKRFLPTNLGEAGDQQCQLFELEGRVLTAPGVSLRFVKNVLDQEKRDSGNSAYNYSPEGWSYIIIFQGPRHSCSP